MSNAARAEAERLLAEGDADGAFGAFRRVLEYPGAVGSDRRWRESFELFSRIASELAGPDLGGLVLQVARNPADVNALYDLGYELYEHGLYAIAATALARANALAPARPKIVTELATNLEHLMRNREACRVLRDAGDLVESDELCRYLYVFHSLMSGDRAEAERLLPSLEDSQSRRIAKMARAVRGILVRAEALGGVSPLDGRSLRAWHLALNGCALLHLSPYAAEGMNGRYAYVADSYGLIREGIERLRAALAAAGIAPARAFALPDRSCRILGRATAELLGIPYAEWPPGGTEEPGLIVAYDLDHHESVDVLEELRRHRPGQILWAHASCWTQPFPYAPDLSTFLYEALSIPWIGRRHLAPDPEGAGPSAADGDPTEEELAARIVAAELPAERQDGDEELAALLGAIRTVPPPHAAGPFLDEGPRALQRIGGPVKSNYFG